VAITKNPFYFLWVGALGRVVVRHKGFVAGLSVAFGAVVLFSALRPSPTQSHTIVRQPEVLERRAIQPYQARLPERPPELPPNTSPSCPGVQMNVVLGPSFQEINPNGCFLYFRVDKGRIIISGPSFQTEVGPEGADLMGNVFNRARSKGGLANLRYINCSAPKRDMNSLDCR
jgi:hypothetical protein